MEKLWFSHQFSPPSSTATVLITIQGDTIVIFRNDGTIMLRFYGDFGEYVKQ